ncbi:response regulator transcription factor [Dawidia soli]|uniref:Response regulator transcription factor n=1 Tax=Dawidia soli TaxID=2782352 RepID=A0AAP2GCR7_9BACT|nr:response regulator transcription factor [Dawidia soli]MBT1686437.1 response regulator transcription factor [Dawidia soli]
MRILVVEDEERLCRSIKKVLEENHYMVDVAYDGEMGLKFAFQYDYDSVVLDVVLPGMSGLALCRAIKGAKPLTPILMLTALGTTEDKVIGLESGADDYLLKPFEFAELIARIRALIRRAKAYQAPDSVLMQYEDLKLDTSRKVAVRDGRDIALTAKEFQLLEYFMLNKGRIITRSELAAKVWGLQSDSSTNVVEVYLNILRKKVDRDFDSKLIHTRKGLGYILQRDQ